KITLTKETAWQQLHATNAKVTNAFMLAMIMTNTKGNKMLTRPVNNNNEGNNTENDDTKNDSPNNFDNLIANIILS
ncbi:25332_t:CDS:1, partial [Racocetra persica]